MIGVQQELPIDFAVGDGVLIHRFNKLSDESLFTFNWVPVVSDDNPNPEVFYTSNNPEYNEEEKKFYLRLIPRDVTLAIESAKNDIDREASIICSKYMTVGIGQEMRYMEKCSQAAEALRLKSEGASLVLSDYPMIHQESFSCDMEFLDKAQEIIDMKNSWMQVASRVESLRVGGKKLISKLESIPEILEKKIEIISKLRSL